MAADDARKPFQLFKPLDRVRHIDGSEGTVERVTGDRVTVQFPYRWRSSVVDAKNLTVVEVESAQGQTSVGEGFD